MNIRLTKLHKRQFFKVWTRDTSRTDLFGEGVPRLPESPLLVAQLRASSHRRQQRHDGPALLVEGHQERLEHLKEGERL